MNTAQWPPEHLLNLPSKVAGWIQDALDKGNGERTLQDVFSEILQNKKQLWVRSEEEEFTTAAVTQVIDTPQKRICEITYLGGVAAKNTGFDFLDGISVIEDWARENGCTDITAIGREAWVRALRHLDYEKRYTTVGKKL